MSRAASVTGIATTAVPYAQISVQFSPISEVSNRMAITAFPPRVRASSIIRPMTSLRLLIRLVVMPLSSPPTSDLKPAPICENALRERTVRPKTSPQTCRISQPGMSFVVTTSIGTLLHRARSSDLPVLAPIGADHTEGEETPATARAARYGGVSFRHGDPSGKGASLGARRDACALLVGGPRRDAGARL